MRPIEQKKDLLSTTIILSVILILSIFTSLANSQIDHSLTLPCTINTYGSAWTGAITFDLMNAPAGGNFYGLIVMDTNRGDFGDPSHQLQQNSENGENQTWSFNNPGAVLVEVNPAGQVVRTDISGRVVRL